MQNALPSATCTSRWLWFGSPVVAAHPHLFSVAISSSPLASLEAVGEEPLVRFAGTQANGGVSSSKQGSGVLSSQPSAAGNWVTCRFLSRRRKPLSDGTPNGKLHVISNAAECGTLCVLGAVGRCMQGAPATGEQRFQPPLAVPKVYIVSKTLLPPGPPLSISSYLVLPAPPSRIPWPRPAHGARLRPRPHPSWPSVPSDSLLPAAPQTEG